MAASSLGTVLIQRIDAALGNAASSQTSIARSATDAVRQPAQTDRGQNIANQVQRDQRENVDRVSQQVRSDRGKGIDRAVTQTPGRAALPSGLTNTSVNTTLGSAARIILQLFANHSFGSTPVQGRQPLINQTPNNPNSYNNNKTGTANQSNNNPANLGNQNLTSAQLTRAQNLINSITNNNHTLIGSRITQAINSAYSANGASNNQLSAQIARALAQNISQSGLFYESHIKAYTNGQFKLADIRQEPQAQQARAGANNTNTTSQPTATSGQTSTATNTSNTNINTATTAQNVATTVSGQNTNTPATANLLSLSPTPGVDPNTHNIVRQQLEVLADQSIQWRGEVWPGAEMQWRIQRNDSEQNPNKSENDEQAQWQTNLKLKLPTLGNISANIGVSGNKIFLNIQAQAEQIENLQTNSEQLIQQLSDRQLQLAQLNLDAFDFDDIKTDNKNIDAPSQAEE